MNNLNEKTEETEKKIHLLVTNLCTRNCPNCCNKCYSLNDIPVVTEDELKHCETLFLTGGEPFEFCNPNALAKYYKEHYSNIKQVIVYTNVSEFFEYVKQGGYLTFIDGLSISIKSKADFHIWNNMVMNIGFEVKLMRLTHNRLYCFLDDKNIKTFPNFPLIYRKWVDYREWKPADDSIFRRAF